MKRTLALLLTVALLLITAHRLPAPFSEEPETTPTPKPKREAAPRAKPKSEATPKPAAASNKSLAGTWSGSAATIGTNETCFFVIKIANDEKTVLISWKLGGENSEFATSDGPPELATCTRFGNALSWSPPSLKQVGEGCTDTLRLNSNGTATFARALTSANGHSTFSSTGTFTRQ